MHLLEKIQDCKTMNELDRLRDEIAVAGIYGEIEDFPHLKSTFLKKKEELANPILLREKKTGGKISGINKKN